MKHLFALLALLVSTAACSSREPAPVTFDSAHEPCRFCRMTGSDGRTAAQLLVPGEEPMFFDDIGCLRDHVRAAGTLREGTAVFVVDHHSRAWTRADRGVFTRQDRLATPMDSHLMAHASETSRDADADAKGGTPVTFTDIFKGTTLAGGRQ